MHRMLAGALCALFLAAAVPTLTAQTESDLREKAEVAWKTKNWTEAAAAYGKLTEVAAKDGQAWHRFGYALHALGKLEEALPVHKRAAEFPGVGATATYNVACVYALTGKKDDAIEWLGKAVKAGFNNKAHLAQDGDMDTLRADPRFKEILGGLKAPTATGYVGNNARQDCRLSYWNNSTSAGQVAVSYGPVSWKDAYSKQIESPKFVNRRWRLGSNFWTTLDTSMPMKIGGQKIPAGYFYLTLEKKDDGRFILAFNDPSKIRQKKLDAFVAHLTKGGIEVPMEMAKSDKNAKQLKIHFMEKSPSAGKGKLHIRFGPHVLSTPFVTPFAKKTDY